MIKINENLETACYKTILVFIVAAGFFLMLWSLSPKVDRSTGPICFKINVAKSPVGSFALPLIGCTLVVLGYIELRLFQTKCRFLQLEKEVKHEEEELKTIEEELRRLEDEDKKIERELAKIERQEEKISHTLEELKKQSEK